MFTVKNPPLIAVGESHMGCVRNHNEDNFFCISLYPGYCFTAVADGVGGHSAGEQASYLCCHRLILDWKELLKRNTHPNDAQIADFLTKSVKQANKDINRINRIQHKVHNPMCTTIAAVVFTEQMAIVVHAGDSRVYCSRNGKFFSLTTDHTVQNEMVAMGVTDASKIPGAHVISKAIGIDRYFEPEIHTFYRAPEDRYLLCTDGLTNCWQQDELREVLIGSKSPRQANDRFIRDTLRRRAMDNVTVVSVFPDIEN